MAGLSHDDLQTLAILCAEAADDRKLSAAERERWQDASERLMGGSPGARDLRAAAILAELDGVKQRDAKTGKRYLDLGARARTAAGQ